MLIRTLQQTLELTVYMNTHHSSDSLNSVCDRIAALADGKIVASGSMAEMQACDIRGSSIIFAASGPIWRLAHSIEFEATMETRARYILMGLFVLLITVGGFGFVYWLHNTSSVGEKAVYHVIFQGSVSGLRTGSAVSFNGVRVGEITEIDRPAAAEPVFALISVERKTPVRADTQVDVEVPGLMGSPSIVLKGGASDAAGTRLA